MRRGLLNETDEPRGDLRDKGRCVCRGCVRVRREHVLVQESANTAPAMTGTLMIEVFSITVTGLIAVAGVAVWPGRISPGVMLPCEPPGAATKRGRPVLPNTVAGANVAQNTPISVPIACSSSGGIR